MQARFFRSVRAKLMALSLGLIVVPGAVVAFLASSSATTALEDAVGRQLATVASDGAQGLANAIETERARLTGWVDQELMREVVVGDVDKRISRFLAGEQERLPMLLDAVVIDASQIAVAATDPAVLGTTPVALASRATAAVPGGVAMAGPRSLPGRRGPVLEFAVAIADPEDATATLGTLLATYDWRATTATLAAVRDGVAVLGIGVELLVLDAGGRVIGGTGRDAGAGEGPDVVRTDGWRIARSDGPAYGVEPSVDALVGRAALGEGDPGWSRCWQWWCWPGSPSPPYWPIAWRSRCGC
jgi:hypothetical protein